MASITRALPRAALRPRSRPTCPSRRRIATGNSTIEHEVDPYLPPVNPSAPLTGRRQQVKEAKPFSDFLTDTFNRQHDYLRISLTERCNLRCLYCMPEEGVQLSPNKDLLTTAEIHYLSALFVNQGVSKIRLTGGEPTVRKDIVPLMQQIGSLRRNGLKELALTTNAISLHRKLDSMVEAGLTGVNISLDTLDPFQFQLLTRRAGFSAVMKSIDRVLEMNKLGAGVKLKVNCVVMRGLNDHQILPFIEMGREKDVEVRFIEYMPFGGNKWSENKMLPYAEMLDIIRAQHPSVQRLRGHKNDTSKTYQIPGFVGKIGFITSMTHNFCGTCNRLRITSDGNLKVCLHGNTEVSLRDLLRSDHQGEPMDEGAFEAVRQLELDRRKADTGSDGWISKERHLLDVIGAAVKRKKEKHAGMEELQHMENRPMILIDETTASRRATQLPPRASNKRPSSFKYNSRPATIPYHLLTPTSYGQLRLYSSHSDNDNSSDSKITTVGSDENAQNPSQIPQASSASSFTFQSLKGLFHSGPARGRYSRAKEEPQASDITKTAARQNSDRLRSERSEAQGEEVPQVKFASEGGGPADANADAGANEWAKLTRGLNASDAGPSITRHPTRGAHLETRENESGRPFFSDQVISFSEPAASQSMRQGEIKQSFCTEDVPATPELKKRDRGTTEISPVDRTTRQKGRNPNRKTRPAIRGSRSNPMNPSKSEKVPNPFAGSADAVIQSRIEEPDSNLFGLGEDNEIHTTSPVSENEVATSQIAEENVTTNTPPTETDGPAPPSTTTPKLTHLNTSGEAQMVSVTSKPSTSRTAVAFAYVRFSNPATYSLLTSGANKKGDALSAARIAGIMAAKKTSDLIPLCHPLPLSSVEVDVQPKGFGRTFSPEEMALCTWLGASPKHLRSGCVTLTAMAQCQGPTGVEMEALTAVLVAAATVVDMCKAVDKSMSVEKGTVVYKAGGRSGVTVDRKWGRLVGGQWFESRGLDVPAGVLEGSEK